MDLNRIKINSDFWLSYVMSILFLFLLKYNMI